MNQRHPAITFLWIKNPRSVRLTKAQFELEQSCKNFEIRPQRYVAGPDLIPLGEVLRLARSTCQGTAFVWANSDVTLTQNPYHVPDPTKVYGFFRREIPSKEICYGVDMYYIPIKWWDEYLSKDIPKLYIGASYVDRWITMAMEKAGHYQNLTGYIDHVTHPQSKASGSDTSRYYQSNFKAFNSWAKRNNMQQIPAPPYLIPKIGHVWGIRDAWKKFMRKMSKDKKY